ncbi:MAG: FG-GAP repeat protein [Planctomycetes bacterium]|nr:FG-GAP repeat protein [Planctomycetota bacterium]
MNDMRAAGLVHVLFGGPELTGRICISRLGHDVAGCTLSLSCPVDLPETAALRFGQGVVNAHDVNRDGFDDVLISAPGWDLDEAESHWDGGSVILLYGRATFPTYVDTLDPTSGRTQFFSTVGGDLMPNMLGRYIASAGDMNGDSRREFIVSTSSQRAIPGAVAMRGFLMASLPPDPTDQIEVRTPTVICAVASSNPGLRIEGAAPVPDFNGDGFADTLVSASDFLPTRKGFSGQGAAYLLLGRLEMPGEIHVEQSPEYSIQFLAWESYSLLGRGMAAGDLNGDGFTDLAIGAPGHCHGTYATNPIGRVYVVLGRADCREPLAVTTFSPPVCPLAGGARITLNGQGFTSRTRAFFGGIEAIECQRKDSRRIDVVAPASERPRSVDLWVVDGSREVRYEVPFEYREQPLPLITRIGDIRSHFVRIPRDLTGPFTGFASFLGRTHDVTGDGIDDLLFCTRESLTADWLERVYLLRGGSHLPPLISQDSLSRYGTSFFIPDTRMGLREATAIGDIDGDGLGDIGVGVLRTGELFMIRGGTFGDGEEDIYAVFARGGAHVVRDGYDSASTSSMAGVGDFNGDGYDDVAIGDAKGEQTNGNVGTIAFAMGSDHPPVSTAFADLPMIIGRVPPGGYYSSTKRPFPLGDVDGDGFDDIGLISCLMVDDAESEGDQRFYDVYVVFGRPVLSHRSTIEDEVRQGNAIRIAYCDEFYDEGNRHYIRWVVWSLCTAGDVDGDGFPDTLLRVRNNVTNSPAPGEGVYIIRGGPRSRIAQNLRLGHPEEFDGAVLWDLAYNNSTYGVGPICGGYDFSGDGRPDFLIAETKNMNENPGRLFIVFDPMLNQKKIHFFSDIPRGTLPGLVLEDEESLSEDWPNISILAGDLNDDGFEDIASVVYQGVFIWLNPNGTGVNRKLDFIRGDGNQDGRRDIGDPIYVLNYLFMPDGLVPPCADAADANDDGSLDLGDPVYLLNWIFASGSPPAEPASICGPDPTDDALGCVESACP